MSNRGGSERTFASAIRHVWRLGGFRAYYRGLSVRLVRRPITVKLNFYLKTDWVGRRLPVRLRPQLGMHNINWLTPLSLPHQLFGDRHEHFRSTETGVSAIHREAGTRCIGFTRVWKYLGKRWRDERLSLESCSHTTPGLGLFWSPADLHWGLGRGCEDLGT